MPDPLIGRWLGNRSLLSWAFGDFFKNTANTSGLLAVVLVGSAIYMFITKGDAPVSLQNFVSLILGFYFGGAIQKRIDEDNSN